MRLEFLLYNEDKKEVLDGNISLPSVVPFVKSSE
jgi:hypothetical protein